MNKKIVLFDWEGVILKKYPQKNNSKDAITNTLKYFNNSLTPEEAFSIYKKTLKDEEGIYISQYNDEENKIKWFKRITKEANINTSFEKFSNKFKEEYLKTSYYEDVVKYAYSLKEKCQIGIFSDLIYFCHDALDKQVNLKNFNYVFLSYETNLLKTDEKSFDNVEKITNINPQNIMFIDDMDFNINNAKKKGWNTCLVEGNNFKKIKEQVENFLKED